jgi:cytochrome c-type biogenesis protein CcmF
LDIGTIFLIAAVIASLIDVGILLAGPKIPGYETKSLYMAMARLAFGVLAFGYMGFLIATNAFQYDYVYATTEISMPWYLKVSALWAGQSGSLIFWSALAVILYFSYRLLTRGYEDDTIVYRAAILMALAVVIILINAVAADPFRITEGVTRTDGLGMNPLLRTIWNVIHPPIVFVAYALAMVPFAIKLAGFTVRSEERNSEPIPVLETMTRFTTVFAWLMLSIGIALGGYWAYIVLGWGGYWAWDPVETTSLVPWLLLTAYYHAKAVLRNNDVLRDSFLVFTYVTVIYATWVTRSGVLNSVHGFSISSVSWTMLASVLITLLLAAVLTVRAGYIDMEDEEVEGPSFFSRKNTRDFSIKIALVGIVIILATSVIGVALPASINLVSALIDYANFADNMVGIGLEFFRAGFYFGCVFLIAAAYYCMKTVLIGERKKSYLLGILLIAGAALALLTVFTGLPLPTHYWPANALIPAGAGGVVYMVVVLARNISGKEPGAFTMRKMGRVMLHLGLIILLLGVFTSENVVYETNMGYLQGDYAEVAPGITIRADEVNLDYWHGQYNFRATVEIQIIEGESTIVGYGYAVISADPEWNSVSHTVYVHSTAFRDVFVAVTGFETVFGNQLMVTLHAKVLPFISFVWLGAFLMIAALVPMAGIEAAMLWEAIRRRDEDLDAFAEESEEDAEAEGDTEVVAEPKARAVQRKPVEPIDKKLLLTRIVRIAMIVIGVLVVSRFVLPWLNWIEVTGNYVSFWYFSSDYMYSLYLAIVFLLAVFMLIALPLVWPKQHRTLIEVGIAFAMMAIGSACLTQSQGYFVVPLVLLGFALNTAGVAILVLARMKQKKE